MPRERAPEGLAGALHWDMCSLESRTPFLAVAALLACASPKSGAPAPVDASRVDVCVLSGSSVSDGCVTSSGVPAVELLDLVPGSSASRVLALYNGAAGDVPAVVSAVALAPAGSGAQYRLSVFELDDVAGEVAVTLPYSLAPSHRNELRVRVTFTAGAPGTVRSVFVAIEASHPATSISVPVHAKVTVCPAGWGECDGDPSNGCEADLTGVDHCGTCGTACSARNGTPACLARSCRISCDPGFAICGGDIGNGCAVELASDPANCGACGNSCAVAEATPACSNGSCGIGSCSDGYADCDGEVATGCESRLANDALHCGACGAPCGPSTAFCYQGACYPSAPFGIHQDPSASALAAAGYTLCHSELYSSSGTSVAAIAGSCNWMNVVVGCRRVGSDRLVVAAAGANGNVFSGADANGVAWYSGADSSWGFAPSGATVDRRPCDVAGSAVDGYAGGAPGERLCWPTEGGTLAAGGRCGVQLVAEADAAGYERVVFSKP